MQTAHTVPHPLPLSPFSHHVQASCSAACPWVRKGERGKGMGQCFVASHTVGSPDKGQCKLKKCAESSHCFVRKPSHNSLCGRIRKREERKAFGCGAILMKEFCANKKTSAPSPSPFPLFSPWAGQLLSSLHMGEKRGRGEGDGGGMGQCFCCPHTMGSPCHC